MGTKNINLKVRQNDLLENKDEIIFDGVGQIDYKNNLEIYYHESDDARVRLRLSENEGLLMRKGEALMQMNFDLNKITQCKVTTSVGDLYMDVKTLDINLEKDKVFLYYELLEADVTVGKFQLRLEWEDE